MAGEGAEMMLLNTPAYTDNTSRGWACFEVVPGRKQISWEICISLKRKRTSGKKNSTWGWGWEKQGRQRDLRCLNWKADDLYDSMETGEH